MFEVFSTDDKLIQMETEVSRYPKPPSVRFFVFLDLKRERKQGIIELLSFFFALLICSLTIGI